MAHRLANASSQYLRQHAHQEVDWWPYSAAAFAEAARLDRPVMLSIGYAACHWCHVMSHESFDDAGIARYLNEHFIPVKVDREQHPLVDDTYMLATQAMTGAGGWPMTVFTLPDGRAFHAGTYYPPVPRGRVPSFGQVLATVHEAWEQRREAVEQQAEALAGHLAELAQGHHRMMGAAPGDRQPGAGIQAAVAGWIAATRATGGFTPAPKFPPTQSLQVIWRQLLGAAEAEELFDAAATTTEALLLGGLQDHVHGGFARYCVDEAWLVPHFEKMLYDNAQLLRMLATCHETASWLATGLEDAERRERAANLATASRRAVDGIVRWLRESMQVPGGPEDSALAASRDADSQRDGHGIEGAYYTFSREQLNELLHPDGGPLPEGLVRFGEVAEDPGHYCLSLARIPQPDEWRQWDELLARAARLAAGRPEPQRDAKVVAGWNGLAIEGLCAAAVIFDEPSYRELAERVAGYLWRVHCEPDTGRLARTSFEAVADHDNEGTLEDYAGLALGLAALGSGGTSPGWTRRAGLLLERAAHFVDERGLARDAVQLDEVLSAQRGNQPAASVLDDAVPAAASLLARALAGQALTALALDESDESVPPRLDRAAALVAHAALVAGKYPTSVAGALEVQALLEGPVQYLHHNGTDPVQLAAMRRLAAALGIPMVPSGAERPAGPGGELRVYPCRHTSCQAPVGEAGQLLEVLHRT